MNEIRVIVRQNVELGYCKFLESEKHIYYIIVKNNMFPTAVRIQICSNLIF